MRDRINARGFCRAEAIFSGRSSKNQMNTYQRNLILSDFHSGDIQAICAVDIFNEGVDVPDVNIIVFNRVTHSRRIFIQQLGRGLRISEGKSKTIVLDFVQDIRRFAAGLDLKSKLSKRPVSVSIGNKVVFKRLGEEDERAEAFLREWLHDVETIEAAGEDAGILRFPPSLDSILGS
jgi:ERCC4-related helicase